MKLYLLSQTERNGYDTFDSCIVCAENENDAKQISPMEGCKTFDEYKYHHWASCAENVKCVQIGIANEWTKAGLILASFNAG